MSPCFKRADANDDTETIAELIYDTDPYIYADLFGSLDVAKLILPRLFEDTRSIFYLGNYFVVTENGAVLGIALLAGDTVTWDADVVRAAFYENGLPVPPSFEAVSEYFDAAYNYIAPGVKACNICVRKDMRGKGIGKILLQNLIKHTQNVDITLNVLAENTAAVRLYSDFGFVVWSTFDDYGGYQNPPVLCHAMILRRK